MLEAAAGDQQAVIKFYKADNSLIIQLEVDPETQNLKVSGQTGVKLSILIRTNTL